MVRRQLLNVNLNYHSAEDAEIYTLSNADLAMFLEGDQAKANRWRSKGIIPNALVAPTASNGRWRYKETAAQWVELGIKFRSWTVTEDQLAEMFKHVITTLDPDTDAAFKLLQDAFNNESSKDFSTFTKTVESKLMAKPKTAKPIAAEAASETPEPVKPKRAVKPKAAKVVEAEDDKVVEAEDDKPETDT